jgi:hypothetical protein
MKIMTLRLPPMLTDETVCHPASIEPLVEMARSSEDYSEASKATGEKRVPMNMVWMGFPPTSKLNSVKAKVITWNNTYYRPGESQVKIYNQKRDYSEIQAKVNTWR